MAANRWGVVLVIAALAACGDDGGGSGADASTDPDAAAPCPFQAPEANRVRYAVVSHPYDADGNQVGNYEVVQVDRAGEITLDVASFAMGRATGGAIAFRADGSVGLVAQSDGTLGIFAVDASGQPTVIDAGYQGDFYAASVVADPDDPDRFFVLDNQWIENGGGIYAVRLACDGSVASEQKILDAKLPAAIAFTGTGDAVLAAEQVGSDPNRDAHLLSWSPTAPTLVASADAFPDDEAIRSAGALTADGSFFLVGDNSSFSGVPNRVGVLSVSADSIQSVQVLSPIEDPYAIVTSPWDNAAIVVSGFGDQIVELSYDPGGDPPFAVVGQLASVPLPGSAVMIEQGELRGLVLVAENVGIHRVQLASTGVTDLGGTVRSGGTENIVGAIGVQP